MRARTGMTLVALTAAAMTWPIAGSGPASSSSSSSSTTTSSDTKDDHAQAREEINIMAIEIRSDAFANGERIPARYTGDGEDVSPPLSWDAGPDSTKCYALIMDDPDAPVGTWVHWVAWNIVDSTLPENAAAGLEEGTNSWKKNGYGGPAPPPGKPHRYFFKVFALDSKLDLPSATTKDQLIKAMQGHVLAEGELMGTYGR